MMDRHYPAGATVATDGQLLTAVARPAGQLERLPKWLILVPMVIQWLWLGIRKLTQLFFRQHHLIGRYPPSNSYSLKRFTMSATSSSNDFPVVCVGGWAGGLDAYT